MCGQAQELQGYMLYSSHRIGFRTLAVIHLTGAAWIGAAVSIIFLLQVFYYILDFWKNFLKRNLIFKCKMVQVLWKIVWQPLKKLKIELKRAYDPEIPLPGIYSKELQAGS